MSHSVNETRRFKVVMFTVACMMLLPLLAPPDTAQARRGSDNDDRSDYYGIVQSRPLDVLEGVWVIGGRTFQADAGTESDQRAGALTVGRCAKVHIRNGRVHEIDSEPLRNCQQIRD